VKINHHEKTYSEYQLLYCMMFFLSFYIIAGPGFVSPVADDIENEGSSANFDCQATGLPVPTICWYFNDVPVDMTNTVKYNVLSNAPGQSTLRIINVQSSDVGTYTCKATNVVSSDTSSGVLTVNGEFTFQLIL